MSVVNRIAAWLRDRLDDSGAECLVFGLSGGVDSAVTAAVAVQAHGAEYTLGVLMPCHSMSEDAALAQLVADAFEIETMLVDLGDSYDALISALPPSDHPLASANIKPRLRMTTLYYLAQTHNYLVLGSGNKTELMVGYFTKYGDGGVDLLPLGDLYKTEVWALARELGVPKAVVERAPSAGLWPGQTDEGEMGITYEALDRVLKAIAKGDTGHIEPVILAKVQQMITRSAHKRAMPPIFDVDDEKNEE